MSLSFEWNNRCDWKERSLLVVNVIGNHGNLRTKDIMKELSISPRTLSDTLKDLENLGLINRQAFNEIPPRVEYSLTQNGRKLRKAILPLLEWASAMTEDGNFESCCNKENKNIINIEKLYS